MLFFFGGGGGLLLFFFQTKNIDFFLTSLQKHMLWYSLEVPHQGATNEYHIICFHREMRTILSVSPCNWTIELISTTDLLTSSSDNGSYTRNQQNTASFTHVSLHIWMPKI